MGWIQTFILTASTLLSVRVSQKQISYEDKRQNICEGVQKVTIVFPHRAMIVVGLTTGRKNVNKETMQMIVLRYIEDNRSMTWSSIYVIRVSCGTDVSQLLKHIYVLLVCIKFAYNEI